MRASSGGQQDGFRRLLVLWVIVIVTAQAAAQVPVQPTTGVSSVTNIARWPVSPDMQ
jgi:hypothetical protein